MTRSAVFFTLGEDGIATDHLGAVDVSEQGREDALALIKKEAKTRGIEEPCAVERRSVAVRDWVEIGRRTYMWAYIPKDDS